ncbi:MAG: pyruvate, phosphate dikinase [Syntrophomonadaceae bacterium]|nr:pyruvate, phosphate dikinase [Syntrophomonadaceae bacterium]
MANSRYIYLFGEGDAGQKLLLGGKGANLAEMTKIGLAVPPGFTITTEACKRYYAGGKVFPHGLEEELHQMLQVLEKQTGKKFGHPADPLLISVRSGAPVSMPGMMDTILNLGLNDTTVEGLAKATGDRRFAFDCYRRFIQMFGDVVLGVEHRLFENALENLKAKAEARLDHQLPAELLIQLVEEYKGLVLRYARVPFPQEPARQLNMAIQAVFASWHTPRAVTYRKVNKIPDDLGTAVNVQAMVFGNMGSDCGTGVAFTRNPSTGERALYGEYLLNAQGEDVVAGIRTPEPIASLAKDLPEAFRQLADTCQLLERHYREMQDIEFTIERDRLFILQTRSGKRTAAAAVNIAVAMVNEGLITKEEALQRVDPGQLEQLLHRRIDPAAKLQVIARGLPASPGAATGVVTLDADTAEKLAGEGRKVILVRTETTPDDIHGMVAAQGILTSRGGMTSHAAVVARHMGKPCVAGCDALKILPDEEQIIVGDSRIRTGETISIDGGTGRVIMGQIPMIDPQLSDEFQTLLGWADELRRLDVRANADTPKDAAKAREFGAAGIGLCRTEHMFMAQDRLPIVQEMILAADKEEREEALAKLLPLQREDFYGIFQAMEGYPVTIRLLDPPLHEFLPNSEDLAVEINTLRLTGGDKALLAEKEALLRKVRSLSEYNPMLGHRGCRLGISYPEIYAMQVRAIFLAATDLVRAGCRLYPEIEIPLVGMVEELAVLKDLVNAVASRVQAETGIAVSYTVGTMIEVPRACATADKLAREAEFFSFGTNDLTQTTLGFSRDDAEGKFLAVYLEKKILKDNPFVVLDREGVGSLMAMAVEKGRRERPDLLIGICGEHGGEPLSIEFCHHLGLDYVSCSPYRVPIARLAAAQAAVIKKGQLK